MPHAVGDNQSLSLKYLNFIILNFSFFWKIIEKWIACGYMCGLNLST